MFTNDLETNFLEGQHLAPLVWLQYVDEGINLNVSLVNLAEEKNVY